jgi:hypothetical protein
MLYIHASPNEPAHILHRDKSRLGLPQLSPFTHVTRSGVAVSLFLTSQMSRNAHSLQNALTSPH